MAAKVVARWASRSGKYTVALEDMGGGAYGHHCYDGAGIAVGGVRYHDSEDEAIAYVEENVAIAGIAMPDDAKTPMERTL